MIRGFVLGILSGGVASALGLGIVSYFVPPTGLAGTDAVAPASPAPDTPAEAPAGETASPPSAIVPDAPAGSVMPKAPATGETPTAPTETDPAVQTPDKEDDKDDGAALNPAPVDQDITASAPDAVPATEMNSVAKDVAPVPAVPSVSTEPAVSDTPPAGGVIKTPPVLAPAADTDIPKADPPAIAQADVAAPETGHPDALATIALDAAPIAPLAPAAPPKVALGATPQPADEPLVEADGPALAADLPAPATPTKPDALPQVIADATPAQVDPPPPPPAEPEPRLLTEDPPLEDSNTATLAPAARLGDVADGVVTGRLPRIGDPATDPAADGEQAAKTPLVEFARAFENPDQKPIYSIVLIDNGAADLDRKALADLPFPVSFAIDPMWDNAAALAAIYRDAGQEVLMMATGIPEGATASDLEVSLAALSAKLPEAVAVLEQVDVVFQDNRPLATQIVPILAAQGRGLVTWDQGLNAADQVARREGLPSAMAFRSLDSEGEGTETIRRYLDRAAFRAAQEGRVVVVGTTRPETIEALIAWGLEGRSATVALAPISAALTVN